MSSPDHASLRAQVLARRPGHSLPAPFYTASEIFDADMELIFWRHWIYVGVEPDVAKIGDVMTVTLGSASVLIVRGHDDRVRAFHNVCRHRGARLIDDPAASLTHLVCRYHGWSYGLDGILKFAAHMQSDFDMGCHGLKPVHLKSLAGLLFVCLADSPPTDFDDMARVMKPYIEPHDVAGCKVAHAEDYIESGNWKLTLENNRECYHCAANHPELMNPLFAFGFGYAPSQANPREAQQERQYRQKVVDAVVDWQAAGLPYELVEHLDDQPTGYRCERLVIAGTGESQTLDTKIACQKLLGNFTSACLGGLSFWTQPNSWHHFMSDHIVSITALPLAADRTLVRTKWLVRKDAEEGVDYDLRTLTKVWRATNHQDGALVEMVQRGASDPAYDPGPYSPYTEGLVDQFCNWYTRQMIVQIDADHAAHAGL